MIVYRDCIAINTGINKPHTLQIKNTRINIDYMNNLNSNSIIKYIVNNNYRVIAIAYDKQNEKYFIYQNGKYTFALKKQTIKKLTVPEMIAKYKLEITEQEYKKNFSIS